MQYPWFCGPSYKLKNATVHGARTINLYPEIVEMPGGKNDIHLLHTPGYETWIDLPSSPNRGSLYQNGRAFVVAGDTYYEVFADRTYNAIGTVSFADANPATISSSGGGGNQNFITAGGKGYLHDLVTGAFTEVLSSDCHYGAFLEGYFLALNTTDSIVRQSGLFDGATWPALSFVQRSHVGDKWVAMITNIDLLLLIGEQTSDAYYFSGTVPFAFTKMPGGTMRWGTPANFSASQFGNGVAMLGQNEDGKGQVVFVQGSSGRIISDQFVSTLLGEATDISGAIGETYEEEGHTFYLLTLPSLNQTVAYDARSQMWHERGTWISEQARYAYQRATFHMFAFGEHLWGDRETGTIYRSSLSLHRDVDDRPLRRVRRGPMFHRGEKISSLYANYFEIDVERGLGLVSGQGSDPMMQLNLSKNGKRWYSAGMRSIGKQGEFDKTIKWNRLGQFAQQGQAEIVIADPVPVRISNAYLGLRGEA